VNKKIYFAGSIRGGRDDAQLYAELIDYMKRSDRVLSEHIGRKNIEAEEDAAQQTDRDIYLQDTAWIHECDLLIAECTNASLGVGYELAYAEKLGKPCHILYRPAKARLSAMLAGDDTFHVYPYETVDEARAILDGLLGR